jgi:class 3 adenylate cyclase
MAVFANPTEAVSAAVESQRTLSAEAWEAAIADFTVRMGIHTGSGQLVNGDYLGSAPNKAARIEAAGRSVRTSSWSRATLRKAGECVE